eukprot:GILJ01008877.1.p1 GENE.GILJ01008877.1~~GILJ01008877.1.p1  ORF type:complete len:238 (+),score=33.57 GILJ01008877.1:62-775(+)
MTATASTPRKELSSVLESIDWKQSEFSDHDFFLDTPRGRIHGLAYPPVLRTASESVSTMPFLAILLSSSYGGMEGPSGVYHDIARHLQEAGVLALRVDYRTTNISESVMDLTYLIDQLQKAYEVKRVVLIGWSLGGAVAIKVGHLVANVVGVAALAPTEEGTENAIEWLGVSNKRLLLLHGAQDTILSPEVSRKLYNRAAEPKEMVLLPDGHGFPTCREQLQERVLSFACQCFGISQ